MSFKKSSFYLVLIDSLTLILVAGLGIYAIINVKAGNEAYSAMRSENFSTGLQKNSLYDKTSERYYKRIYEARSRFKSKVLINEPCNIVVFGDESINASYDTIFKCVLFTERAVQDLTIDELTGVMAHEFAHAEEMEKVGVDIRPHWMVDVRAAQIAGKSGITSLVERFKKSSDKAMTLLNRHPYLFYLAIHLGGFGSADKEYRERLGHLYELKD